MKYKFRNILCTQCKYLLREHVPIFYAEGKPHCCEYCQTVTIQKVISRDIPLAKPGLWDIFFNISHYIK